MNTPYFSSPTSIHWWPRSRPSSKLPKERTPEPTTPSRTHFTLQADGPAPDQPPKPSSLFGNFASAIRLKPKKNAHTTAAQESPKAPAPFITPSPNSIESHGPLKSRPYSKAVSAVTVTDEDSIEPKTPSDLNLSCQKSLVEADPFAATHGVALSSPKEPQGSDQLFVLPNARVTKDSPVSPRTAYRRPQTPNPQLTRDRLVSESMVSSHQPAASRPTVTIRTQSDILNTRPSLRARKASMNDISSLTITSPVSAPTPSTCRRSMGKSTDGPRPHTRPRGMTDNTGIRPSLKKDVDRPSLTRQSSFSRSVITPPETSPPSQELPPVPSLKHFSVSPNSDRSPSDPSSSASTLTFASSTSEYEPASKTVCAEDKRLQCIRDQAKVPSEPRAKSPTRVLRGALSPTFSRRPATAEDRLSPLKKMSSQPSLHNRLTGPLLCAGDQCPGVDDVLGSGKFLKKQRSFHHPRVPVPPLPYLRHATSFTPSETPVLQSADLSKDKERQKEKRESITSLSKRRFLPGSIRRGSISHAATFTFDDDTGSLIIPPSELDRLDKCPPPLFTNPFGSPGVESMILPATSTFYDDLTSSPTTISNFPHSVDAQPHDTGPQQILSAAQLLKLEEILESYGSEASTDPSSRTSSAELSSSIEPLPPPLFEEFGFNNRSPRKKDSWTDSIVSASTIFSSTLSDKIAFPDRVETGSTLSFFDQQQHPGYRPRTASGNLPSLDSNFPIKRSHSAFPSSSMGIESAFGIEPNQPLGGLTPPPRLRPKLATSMKNVEGSGNRGSVAHIQPLSPPPLRRNPTSISTSSRSTSSRSSPLSSPKPLPSASKNDPPIKGIMKKPSFLDIYDDSEADARLRAQVVVSGDIHKRSTSVSSIDDSFLDLGRENSSFDTIRTLSVEGPD